MKEEHLNIEQRLERLKNEGTFKVPDKYFENFAGRLRARIAEENHPADRIWQISYYLKPLLGIAAVLAILFTMVLVPVNLTKNRGNELTDASEQNQEKVIGINSSGEIEQITEALTMLPQSQFLSALETAGTEEEIIFADSDELEEYLADNSLDYELFNY